MEPVIEESKILLDNYLKHSHEEGKCSETKSASLLQLLHIISKSLLLISCTRFSKLGISIWLDSIYQNIIDDYDIFEDKTFNLVRKYEICKQLIQDMSGVILLMILISSQEIDTQSERFLILSFLLGKWISQLPSIVKFVKKYDNNADKLYIDSVKKIVSIVNKTKQYSWKLEDTVFILTR